MRKRRVVPLRAPIVRIESRSRPTRPDVADATVTVSWHPVADARRYDAYILEVGRWERLVEKDVTSPYIFRGLTLKDAESGTFGIKAHP